MISVKSVFKSRTVSLLAAVHFSLLTVVNVALERLEYLLFDALLKLTAKKNIFQENFWRKFAAPKKVVTPKGRRSHTATVFQVRVKVIFF